MMQIENLSSRTVHLMRDGQIISTLFPGVQFIAEVERHTPTHIKTEKGTVDALVFNDGSGLVLIKIQDHPQTFGPNGMSLG